MEEMMEDGKNRDQDETEDVKMKLDSVLFKLQSILSDRIEHDPKEYKKSLSIFEKHLDRMPKLNDTALQRAPCTFGQESFAPVRMSKQKKARMIPIQVTARSRRKYTMRGSRVAQSGAPRKENGLTRQLVVGEEEDVVYYKLLGAKKKQKKNKHDIMELLTMPEEQRKKH